MPEGRMLRKKISRDEVVAKLSDKAIILYTWCIPHLDVRGKILADAHILKGVVVPYLKGFTLTNIEKCIKELGDSGLVIVYGEYHKYMKFNGFSKNQKIDEDREALSEIPDPTQEELTSNSRVTPAKDKISKDKISEDTTPSFLDTLKNNVAYKHIDVGQELAKMDAWLLVHKGRKKTPKFVVAWLNRIDKPLEPEKEQPQGAAGRELK